MKHDIPWLGNGVLMSTDSVVPVRFATYLSHAVVHDIAELQGIDLLHIKGAAIDPSLRPAIEIVTDDGETVRRTTRRHSTDADVLVRPNDAGRLLDELTRHQWRIVTDFGSGSAFYHAASLWHPYLGYVDVHRNYPGFTVDPELAF